MLNKVRTIAKMTIPKDYSFSEIMVNNFNDGLARVIEGDFTTPTKYAETTFFDYFDDVTKKSVTPLNSLKHTENQEYAIVFFQISDEAWKEFGWGLIKKAFEDNTGNELIDKAPPSKVFLTKFENVNLKNLGCELLQG